MPRDLLAIYEPTDKTVYNKMTEFFITIVENKFSAEHYGYGIIPV